MTNRENSGLAHGTKGSPQLTFSNFDMEAKAKEIEASLEKSAQEEKLPAFSDKGHVTPKSIEENMGLFIGKSVNEIEQLLREHGYLTEERGSTHFGSKAEILVILNPSKDRNITQVQVSPYSRRHGNVPYVKISTSDLGRIKIIDSEEPKNYKTDGAEKAKLLYRRKFK